MFISSYRNSLCLDIIYGINCQENRKKRIDHEQVAWFEMFDFPFCMCFVRSLLSSCNFFQTKCVYMYFVIVYLRVARSCELQFTIFVHNSLIQIIICSQDIINYICIVSKRSALHRNIFHFFSLSDVIDLNILFFFHYLLAIYMQISEETSIN